MCVFCEEKNAQVTVDVNTHMVQNLCKNGIRCCVSKHASYPCLVHFGFNHPFNWIPVTGFACIFYVFKISLVESDCLMQIYRNVFQNKSLIVYFYLVTKAEF